MKVKVRKYKKSPAPLTAEQVKNETKDIEYVSISLKRMIEGARERST